MKITNSSIYFLFNIHSILCASFEGFNTDIQENIQRRLTDDDRAAFRLTEKSTSNLIIKNDYVYYRPLDNESIKVSRQLKDNPCKIFVSRQKISDIMLKPCVTALINLQNHAYIPSSAPSPPERTIVNPQFFLKTLEINTCNDEFIKVIERLYDTIEHLLLSCVPSRQMMDAIANYFFASNGRQKLLSVGNLFETVGRMENLAVLRLRNLEATQSEAEILAINLAHLKRFRSLEIELDDVSNYLLKLPPYFDRYETLEEIRIVSLKGNYDGWITFAHKMKFIQNLKHLDLSGSVIPRQVSLTIVHAFSQMQLSKVSVLKLTNIQLKDEGILSFAQNIQNLKSLKVLELRNVGMTDRGLYRLLEAIEYSDNTGIKVDVSDNDLSRYAINAGKRLRTKSNLAQFIYEEEDELFSWFTKF